MAKNIVALIVMKTLKKKRLSTECSSHRMTTGVLDQARNNLMSLLVLSSHVFFSFIYLFIFQELKKIMHISSLVSMHFSNLRMGLKQV